MAHRSLLVLPDDTARVILEAIAGAKRSLRVKMFVFSDPTLIAALVAAKGRGIDVRVMLNPARRDGEEENAVARRALEAAGVEVTDSNPAFVLTHEKSMVVDESVAFVKSLNWATENLTQTRDYAIVTNHPHEVAEVVECFEADWNRQTFDAGPAARLVWCPGNGRERICHFIDDAKHTLFVQNERYQDAVVIERLVRAARRGVKVHVMVRAPHALKLDKLVEGVGGLRILDDVGVKVHKLKHLKLHAKVFLVDNTAAMVGSINLAPGSLDGRRELAIEARDTEVVERLHEVTHHDWKNSNPLDLSDEGLREDLADRENAAQLLVLDENNVRLSCILAAARIVALAALVATVAPASAGAQPALTNGATAADGAALVRVNGCDPQRSVSLPAYGAFTPGFYPLAPYYWTDPYGFQFSQPPLVPTSGTLSLDYVNITTRVMKTIDFGLIARGHLVAEVRDVGTFSPNAEIKHQFGLDPNVFPLRTALAQCVPLHIVYADGTTWKTAHLPAMRREMYHRHH